MQCNYNAFIQIINFHGLFRNANLRCRKTGACRILVSLRYNMYIIHTCTYVCSNGFNKHPGIKQFRNLCGTIKLSDYMSQFNNKTVITCVHVCFYTTVYGKHAYRKSGWLWTPGWLWTCYRNNVMSITLVYLFSFSKIFLNVLIGQCMNIINDYEFLTYFVTVHTFHAFFWRTQKTRYWNSGQTFRSSTGGGIVITKVQQTHVYTPDI